MASAFNLTAQINIAGPANIKPVVGKIQKQLQGIKTTVNIKIDRKVAAQLRSINKNITSLNSSLKTLNKTSQGASRGLNSLASGSVSSKIARTSQSMNALSRATKNSGNTLQNTNKQLQKSGNLMQAFGKHVALAAKKFAAFSLVTGIIYRVSNAIDVAVSEFVEFDRQLTRVSQVTGTSMQGLKGLESTVRNLATGLGVSSQSLIKVSTTLAQAGLTAEQTRQALTALAKTSLAPTFGDINDTVEGSIAIMRQFSISTRELEGALGSINAVASQFAVESQDVITAVKRAGGVFAAASKGVATGTEALNQFMAIFTSIRATTREGAETIATGLRTIFTRLQRGDTIEALKGIGVELRDLQGNFVGPYEAVRRLSIALAGVDPRSAKFAAIAEQLGGFRQIGKVIPMLQQFNTAQAALFAAQKGGGSLTKDATIAQAALATQIQKTREQFISFIASLSNNQGLKQMATLALKVATAILKITEAIGPAMPALTIMLGGKLARGGLGMMTGKKFAAGGVVPGSGNSDTVPAMLTPGEFVIRKKAVGAIGTDSLHQMNKYAYGGPVSFKGITGAKQGGKSLSPRLAKSKGEAYKQGALINAGDKFSQDINEKEFTSLSIGATLKGKRGAAATIRKLSDRNQNVRGAEFENFLAKYIAGAGNKTTGNAPLDFTGPPGEAKFQTRGVPYRDLLSKTLRQRIDSGKYASLRDSKGGVPSESLQSFENIYASGINLFKLKGKFNAKTARDAAGLNKKKLKATGGGISGSDTVPALLTPGEFVINKKSASRIGASKLHSMNQADRITGYNKGGFVGFSKGGKAKKDAGQIAQAQKMNPKAMKDLEANLKASGLAAEEVRAALVAFARSVNKGEDVQTAKNKAIGAAGSQQQGVGHQSTRMAKKGIQQQAQFSQTGQGAPPPDPTAVRQKAMASTGVKTGIAKQQLEGKFGAGTKAAETALKVFEHELAATGNTSKAFSSALSAGKQHATMLSTGLAKLKTNAATFGQKVVNTAGSFGTLAKNVTAASFPTFNRGLKGAAKQFPTLTRAIQSAGKGIKAGAMNIGKKLSAGRKAAFAPGGAMAAGGYGRQMAGAAAVAAGGMGVSGLEEMMKGGSFLAGVTGNTDKSLKATDNSIMAAKMGGGALSGGAMGAQIGSMFGPWGTAIGAAVGALGGLTMGFINARKEIAKAAANEKKNAKQKFDQQTGKSLNTAIDQSKSGSERAEARATYLGRMKASQGQGLSVSKALMDTGSTAEEASAANATGASQTVKFLTSEATRTAKTMAEMQASMPAGEFEMFKQTIANADDAYNKAVKAHGENSVAAKAAADASMENVKEMIDTNAKLAKNKKAISAVAAVSASYVVAARNLNGAMQAAEASFNHASQELATIKDPTAAVSYRNKDLETAMNPASSGAAQGAAYSNMASGLGGTGQAMANMAAMPKSLEEGISKSIQRTMKAGDSETVEKDVKQTVKAKLVAAGVNDKDADIAAGSYAQKIGNMSEDERSTLNVEKDIASDPALAGLMDGANASAEALKKYSSEVGKYFNQLATNARTYAADQQSLRDAEANSIGERMANEDRMNAILGKGQGLQDKLNRINQKSAAQRNARVGQDLSSDPVQAGKQLEKSYKENKQKAAEGRKQRDLGGDTGAAIQGEQQIAKFGQAAKTAEEELRKLPGQLQGSIDAVLSEMETVMAHRSSQIDAASGIMEKALGSTPSEMMKLGKTMNLASAAAQGFAPTIQQSEAAQLAYNKTIAGGGSQKQAQSAAQGAYAQQNQDTLGMVKELMPLMTAAGPEGKKQANNMMANTYESMLAAQQGGNKDAIPPMFKQAIAMLRQDPGEDPQIVALQEQYKLLDEQKGQTEKMVESLDKSNMIDTYRQGNQNVVDAIDNIKIRFKENNEESKKTGTEIPDGSKTKAAGSPAGGPPGSAGAGSAGAGSAGAAGAAGTSSTATGSGTAGSSSGGGAGSGFIPPSNTGKSTFSANKPNTSSSSSTASAGPTRQQKTVAFAQRMQKANTSQGQYNNAASQGHAQQMQQKRLAYAQSTGNDKGLSDEDKKFRAAKNLERRANEQGSEGSGPSGGGDRMPSRNSSRGASGAPASSTAQNQSNGVNTSGLAQFTEKLNNLFTQLANVSIPSEINLTGAFDVNVKLNGAEVLAKIEPRVKEMILEHTGQEINQFAADNFGGEGKSKKVPLGKSADQPTTA
jgi:DNA-binding IscR family transcriptional regulator